MTQDMSYLVVIRPADDADPASHRYIPITLRYDTLEEAQEIAGLLRPKMPDYATVVVLRPQNETGVRYVAV